LPSIPAAIRDDADARAGTDLPDADTVYARYLVTCRRLGIDAVPRELAQRLIAEWSEAIAAGRSIPSITN